MNSLTHRLFQRNGLFLAMLLIFAGQFAIAQEKVKVEAYGSYVSRDLTPEQTRQKALEEAKRDALIKAGVAESITASDFLYTFEDNEKFKEIFQAFTSTETGGEVIIDSILSENRSFDQFGSMTIEVKVKATVFIHKGKEDPTLDIKVDGIEEQYKNNASLKFDITPSIDGYLKIFNVTDEVSSLLFPYIDKEHPYYNDNPSMQLKALQKTTFPVNKAFSDGYSLEITNPEKEKEFDLLIFVFTRKNIAFLDNAADMKQIMNWIYSIPMEERKVVQVGFVISR
jgi:hypothetical protein